MQNQTNKILSITNILGKSKKVSLVSLAVLGLVYLISTNHAANQSFALDNLDKELKNTEHQILLLNVKASELQSIERIENASKGLSLVQTKDVYYLVNQPEVVALK